MSHQEITLAVNGTDYPVSIDTSRNLVSVLRNEIGLTGTKEAATTVSAVPAWCSSTANR